MRPWIVTLTVSLGLMALTFIAYGDMVWNRSYELVMFDDFVYVRDNPNVLSGLSGDGFEWAFTSYAAHNWHPLTWLSLQLDVELFGNDPRGYHLTNLLLHAANSVLLFLMLLRATGAIWPAAATAAFFAVHPLHVESVAWVTERKDVLSTFFWILTLLAYVRYAERPSVSRYCLVLLCLTLGLMSKPMVVTLPCVLLLFDYWPLNRWANAQQPKSPSHGPQASTEHLLLEKIPFFLLAACCSLLTLGAQTQLTNTEVTFGVRILNTLVSYVIYLGQMFWPGDLAILYLHRGKKLSEEVGIAAGLLLSAITLLAWYWRRRKPYFLMGWLWYLGTLVPAIGLFRQVGLQAHADRYTYIPLIGVFIALSWGAAECLGRQRSGRLTLLAVTGGLLIACMIVSASQLRYWRNSASLCDRALQVSGDEPQMHFIIAQGYFLHGDAEMAIRHTEIVLQHKTDHWPTYRLLSVALMQSQRIDEANEVMTRAVKMWPDNAVLRNVMAAILWKQDNIPAAYEQLAVVAQLQPDSAEGQNYLGRMLELKGDLANAADCFLEAVRLTPQRWDYRCDLAYALGESGNHRDASDEFDQAFRISPDWPVENDRLARILAMSVDPKRRDGAEAVRRSLRACKITQFQYAPFLETLAAAYAESGRFKDAVETVGRARDLATESGQTQLAERLGRALSRYRNGQPTRDE